MWPACAVMVVTGERLVKYSSDAVEHITQVNKKNFGHIRLKRFKGKLGTLSSKMTLVFADCL